MGNSIQDPNETMVLFLLLCVHIQIYTSALVYADEGTQSGKGFKEEPDTGESARKIGMNSQKKIGQHKYNDKQGDRNTKSIYFDQGNSTPIYDNIKPVSTSKPEKNVNDNIFGIDNKEASHRFYDTTFLYQKYFVTENYDTNSDKDSSLLDSHVGQNAISPTRSSDGPKSNKDKFYQVPTYAVHKTEDTDQPVDFQFYKDLKPVHQLEHVVTDPPLDQFKTNERNSAHSGVSVEILNSQYDLDETSKSSETLQKNSNNKLSFLSFEVNTNSINPYPSFSPYQEVVVDAANTLNIDRVAGVANISSSSNGTGSKPSARNVSSLLDALMLGYDKRLRPGFGGEPLVVKADIEIRSMGPISEKDMIYSMDCYFRQVWQDIRLAFNATVERVTNVSLNVKMLERIWHPDTIFINGGPSYVHTITTPNKFFRLSYDGTILFSQRLTIKASCPMHLEKFPMDTQKCPLHIASFGYPVTDVIYEWHYGNDLAAVASNDMRLSQFDLKGMPACNMTGSFKGTQHSILTVYFDFRRHTGYFLIQVYVPCCLLVVLSWVSFWINREATSDRISLGATTMLTMTFLVLDSRNDLPRVAYSTALDVYVAMCFCFVFASIVQFAAVHFFTKYGTAEGEERRVPDSDSDDDDDDEAFNPCGISDNYYSNGMKTDSFTACLRKMWRCIMSTRSKRFNKNVRNALGLNSVSKIDKVSRVLFPAAFSGLNIVYWMSYW